MFTNRMKNLGIGLLALAATTLPSAAPAQEAENPFAQGTVKRLLTPEERQSLLQFAENSHARLTAALEEAKGKSYEEIRDIYGKAIKAVVIESYKEKPRSELILRMALNEAMELTLGIPSADGSRIEKPGILSRASNADLNTVILESSIRLALTYYQDDRTAITEGRLLNLPYVQFAMRRLELARGWLTSVMEWNLQYEFSMSVLGDWLSVALEKDQTHQVLFAEEITRVDQVIKDMQAIQAGFTPQNLPASVRKLRAELRKLQETGDPKALTAGTARLRSAILPSGPSSAPLSIGAHPDATLPKKWATSKFLGGSKRVATDANLAKVYRDMGNLLIEDERENIFVTPSNIVPVGDTILMDGAMYYSGKPYSEVTSRHNLEFLVALKPGSETLSTVALPGLTEFSGRFGKLVYSDGLLYGVALHDSDIQNHMGSRRWILGFDLSGGVKTRCKIEGDDSFSDMAIQGRMAFVTGAKQVVAVDLSNCQVQFSIASASGISSYGSVATTKNTVIHLSWEGVIREYSISHEPKLLRQFTLPKGTFYSTGPKPIQMNRWYRHMAVAGNLLYIGSDDGVFVANLEERKVAWLRGANGDHYDDVRVSQGILYKFYQPQPYGVRHIEMVKAPSWSDLSKSSTISAI